MSRQDPGWIQRLDAIYGFALRLYPRQFRGDWEAGMRQAFRDRCREVARGERKPLALLCEMLPDLAAGAGRERVLSLQDATMFKRGLLFSLLLLLATTLLFRERISAAVEDTHQWWRQRQAQLDAGAIHRYWADLAATVEGSAKLPREHAIAALAWSQAGSPQRAQRQLDEAIAGADPAALWLAATDCPALRCDAGAAVARLQRSDPGNAAVEQIAFNQAFHARDGTAMRKAMERLSSAHRYHEYHSDLVKSLLQANGRVAVPSRLRNGSGAMARAAAADALVSHAWRRLAQADFQPLLDHCRPSTPEDAERASRCVATARVLATGNSLASRAYGQRILLRYLHGSPGQAEAVARMRDGYWLVANLDKLGMDESPEAYARWRRAFLGSQGEIGMLHRLMRERGIALAAPEGFKVEAKDFDPGR
jgi:hypothetical protein